MTVQPALPVALLRFNEPESSDVARSVELNDLRLRELIQVELPSPRPPHRRPGRVFAAACGLAVIVLLAGILVSVLRDGAASTPSSEALTAVAERVSKLPDPAAMKPSDSYYTDIRSFTQNWVDPAQLDGAKPGAAGWVQFGRSRLESWISSSGGLRSKMSPKAIEISYPTAADRRNSEAVKGGVVFGVSLPLVDDSHPDRVFTVGEEHLDYEALTNLPSDPVALKAFMASTIHSDSGAGPSADMMRAANALLGYPLRSSVRASIFTVMSRLPGVTVKRGVTDALGRTGDAVIWGDEPYREELIFDPSTGVDLQLSRFLMKPELDGKASRLAVGALSTRETIAARGVVRDRHGKIDPADYAGQVRGGGDR